MENSESANLDILLNVAQIKHDAVLSNLRALDIKISIILAFFGILFFPSLDIFSWTIIKCELLFIKFLPGLISVAGVILCLIALFPQREYSIPNLSALKKMHDEQIKAEQFKAELFSYYNNAVENNGLLARKKVKLLKSAYILLFLSLITTLGLILFLGGQNAR